MRGILHVRRGLQQGGTAFVVGGEPTVDESRHLIHLRGRRELHARLRIRPDEGLNAIPDEQRDDGIVRVLLVGEEGEGDVTALVQRQALEQRGEFAADERGFVFAGEFHKPLKNLNCISTTKVTLPIAKPSLGPKTDCPNTHGFCIGGEEIGQILLTSPSKEMKPEPS